MKTLLQCVVDRDLMSFASDPDRGCVDMDVELFIHVHDTRNSGRKNFTEAEAACKRCPETIRLACLNWALDNHEDGFWGNTTDGERRRERARRARQRGAA